MASKTYVQYYADGTSKEFRRKKQGGKPSGLGKLKSTRLYPTDETLLNRLKEKFGVYWNENEFIRNAVHDKLCNSVYTELLKH